MPLYELDTRPTEAHDFQMLVKSKDIQELLGRARSYIEDNGGGELARILDNKGRIYWRPSHDQNMFFA